MPNRSPAILPRPRTGRCPPSSSALPACCRKRSGSRSASNTPPTSSRTSTRLSRRPARNIGGLRPRNRPARPGMTILFEKHPLTVSPALAPGKPRGAVESDRAGDAADTVLTIGLVNNMPDAALQATERQFIRLLEAAAGNHRIHLHCFSLPSVKRSQPAKSRVDSQYADIADLGRLNIDG